MSPGTTLRTRRLSSFAGVVSDLSFESRGSWPRTVCRASECLARAGVEVLDVFGGGADLFDNPVPFVLRHEFFDLGRVVAGEHEEPSGIGAHTFVFASRHLNLEGAIRVCAFAEVVLIAVPLVRGELVNAFVDFPEQRLVAGETFFPFVERQFRTAGNFAVSFVSSFSDRTVIADLGTMTRGASDANVGRPCRLAQTEADREAIANLFVLTREFAQARSDLRKLLHDVLQVGGC
jgi:hypothetical protein